MSLRAGILASVMILGCGSDDRPPPTSDGGGTAVDVGEGTVEPTREGLIAFVRGGRHAGWLHEPAPHPSLGPHADVQMFFNERYVEARRDERYPMPRGAMAVKELFSSGQRLGYAVALKISDGDGPRTWLWWEATGDLAGGFFGVAQPLCEGCHGDSARDRSLVERLP